MRKLKRTIYILICIALITAMTSNSAAAETRRFLVTCNWNYDNKYNVSGRFSTREAAVSYIRKKPAKTCGQWYIYDSKLKKVVYPLKIKTKEEQVRKAVVWAKAVAEDRRHGYSCAGELSSENLHLVSGRWGRYGDYSCSTLIVAAYELSGFVKIRLTATKKNIRFTQLLGKLHGGKTFRGISSVNLGAVLMETGSFMDVSSSFYNCGMSVLKPGDILIAKNLSHAAMYIGKGRIVEARANERGIEYLENPNPGDQYENEIVSVSMPVCDYYVYRPITHEIITIKPFCSKMS